MIRITRIPGSATVTLKVEGKLLQPWVDELRKTILSEQQTPTALDLAGVSFIDPSGISCLNDLLHQGVTISACSSFVAELLHTVKP